MLRKIISLSVLSLICLELTLNIYYFVNRYRPLQKSIARTIEKLNQSEPSRTIYCIGDEFTTGVGSDSKVNYPKVLQTLLNSNPKYRDFKVLNLGINGSTIESQLYIISQLRPKSRIILRGKVGYLLYSKPLSFNIFDSLQVVKWLRSLFSYPCTSKQEQDLHYYQQTINLIQRKHHKAIYFNYPQIDQFMSLFNLNAYYAGRSMKVKKKGYNYTSMDKKYLSHNLPYLNDLGYSIEAKLLLEFIYKQTSFLN